MPSWPSRGGRGSSGRSRRRRRGRPLCDPRRARRPGGSLSRLLLGGSLQITVGLGDVLGCHLDVEFGLGLDLGLDLGDDLDVLGAAAVVLETGRPVPIAVVPPAATTAAALGHGALAVGQEGELARRLYG